MATVGKLLLRGNRLIGLFLFDHVYDELPLRFRFSAGGIWRLKTVSHGFFSEHESSGLASSLLCRGRILGSFPTFANVCGTPFGAQTRSPACNSNNSSPTW